MDCVRCAAKTRVVRTLQRDEGPHRIRACDGCGLVFRTREVRMPEPGREEIEPLKPGERRG